MSSTVYALLELKSIAAALGALPELEEIYHLPWGGVRNLFHDAVTHALGSAKGAPQPSHSSFHGRVFTASGLGRASSSRDAPLACPGTACLLPRRVNAWDTCAWTAECEDFHRRLLSSSYGNNEPVSNAPNDASTVSGMG